MNGKSLFIDIYGLDSHEPVTGYKYLANELKSIEKTFVIDSKKFLEWFTNLEQGSFCGRYLAYCRFTAQISADSFQTMTAPCGITRPGLMHIFLSMQDIAKKLVPGQRMFAFPEERYKQQSCSLTFIGEKRQNRIELDIYQPTLLLPKDAGCVFCSHGQKSHMITKLSAIEDTTIVRNSAPLFKSDRLV